MNEGEHNHTGRALAVAGIILIALLTAGAYVFFSSGRGNPLGPGGSGGIPPIGGGGGTPPGGNGGPGGTPTTTPPDPNAPTIEVPTASGGKIPVNNFYKHPVELSPAGDVLIAETSNYRFLYIPFDGSFLIVIVNPNMYLARAVAESDVPVILGIPPKEVCALKISLGVPRAVNEAASGREYGISFCPGGIPF